MPLRALAALSATPVAAARPERQPDFDVVCGRPRPARLACPSAAPPSSPPLVPPRVPPPPLPLPLPTRSSRSSRACSPRRPRLARPPATAAGGWWRIRGCSPSRRRPFPSRRPLHRRRLRRRLPPAHLSSLPRGARLARRRHRRRHPLRHRLRTPPRSPTRCSSGSTDAFARLATRSRTSPCTAWDTPWAR